MKTGSRIENRIKHTIWNEFKISDKHITSETNFKEDLGFDEYDMLFLSLALEDEFDVMFTEQLEIGEVKDLVKLIAQQVKTRVHHNWVVEA